MSAPKIYKSATGANLVFACEDESGVIINNYSRNVTTTVAEAADRFNTVQAVAHTAPRGEISISGFVKGDISVQVGLILAVANNTGRYGLSGGTVLVSGMSESAPKGEFATVTITATQYEESLTLAS
jgi:hypothetical protein